MAVGRDLEKLVLIRSFMKILTVIFLMALSSFALAQENTCCFCFGDLSDPKLEKSCARWLKENKKDCSYSQKFEHYESYDNYLEPYGYKLNSEVRCENLKLYGAFHGLSDSYRDIVKLVANTTKNYSPRKVQYDGFSCLVFNNVEQVENWMMALTQKYPEVEFDISGNQNLGAVTSIPLFYKPKEVEAMSSKVTFKAHNSVVEKSFGACSAPGNCFYANFDRGAESDSNLKTCMHQGQESTQRCCEKKKGLNGTKGFWSNPGEDCQK